MDPHTFYGILATLFSLSAYGPYIYDIVKGKACPNRMSWIIWTFVPGMMFISGLVVGSEASNWLTGAYTVGSIIILSLSIKRGEGGREIIDLISLTIALMGVVGWILLKNPLLAYFSFVAADVSGGFPTIKKSFFKPDSESKIAWLLFFLGGLSSILSIRGFDMIQDWLFPVLAAFFQGLICFFLYTRLGESFKRLSRT